jgi:hypothetical protein
LRNYLTFTIRHIVYRNRNNEFSANSNIPQILKNKISKCIKNDLELKFNIAKEKNETALFEERFLENNAGWLLNFKVKFHTFSIPFP